MAVAKPITKADLEDALRHYATKADLNALEARLAQSMTAATRWNVGMMMVSAGAAVTILRLT